MQALSQIKSHSRHFLCYSGKRNSTKLLFTVLSKREILVISNNRTSCKQCRLRRTDEHQKALAVAVVTRRTLVQPGSHCDVAPHTFDMPARNICRQSYNIHITKKHSKT